ncbi:MAG: flagellar assembly protein FliX [Rhodospirillaceae bacterium]|nr:flagellar assembly protein FliX [Rhodospirillaceae bacterium]MDD9929797.1 flagellar assembly protein FliX [Rhodospirillaceae bacterium]
MKIDSSGRVRPSSPQAKGKTNKAAGGGGFASHLDASAESASPVTSAAPTQTVDAVLAIQTVGDATSGGANARARQWGFDTLDELERIRTDLLLGGIPKDRLINLAQMVSARRQRADDPSLNELLDDIELRVRVEIAKYEPRNA